MRKRVTAFAVVVLLLVRVLTSESTLGGLTANPTITGNLLNAANINAGNTPTTSVNVQAVTVSWTASTLSDGRAVSGYVIKRYDAGSGVVQTILSNCTGTVVALTCTENAVPNGSWKYTVTPVFN